MKFGVGDKGNVSRWLTILFLVLLIFPTYPLTSSDAWPMFLNDPQHTGSSTSNAPNTNDTLWTRPLIGGDGWSSPVVANGRVFVNRGGILYSIFENNGTDIWDKSIGYAGMDCSTPTVANGKVYVVGDRLYCFYENNGTDVWDKSISGMGAGTSSPTIAEGKVFVNTQTLYCFYANNGADIWNKAVGGSGESTPAAANGKVVINGDRLYCFDTNDGTEIWNTTGAWSSNSPVIANGRVFYNPGTLYCLYENNGTEIWNKPNGGDGYSSPAVANGKVFVNFGGEIYCYYENDGAEVWNTPDTGEGYSTPAISNDGKVFVNGMGRIYCFNENNGNEIWSDIIGGPSYSSPAIANGKVFLNQGTVYCFGVGGPPPTIDKIVIEDGAQNELTTVTLYLEDSITIFAAGYNSTTSLFMGYVEVNWSGSPVLGVFSPETGASSLYTAGLVSGITTITGENETMGLSDDFIIEIIGPLFSIPLKEGWNMISIPLNTTNTQLEDILSDIDGNYIGVQWYNMSDLQDPWKHYHVDKAGKNDLSNIDNKMGIWILMRVDDTLTVIGFEPVPPTTDIELKIGWNFVGYPSLTSRSSGTGAGEAFESISGSFDLVQYYNASDVLDPWKEWDPGSYSPDDLLEVKPGYGLWIHITNDCTWTVDW
ncbi:MAG: PQQ-binding-like beta-propeller repeat protein [Thermoplasmata archaeon]|nr:MAG: PQQ-binding-like beta-propeller repeat protein [Thermoplasmata archaeon]